MNAYIFGAKATAVGLYRALSILEPEVKITAFLVSDMDGNPCEIGECPVRLLQETVDGLSNAEKADAVVYIAVPELIQETIRKLLAGYGFAHFRMLDARMEADIMERYFQEKGIFPSVRSLPLPSGKPERPKLTIYAASFYKDAPLRHPPQLPSYVKKLYLGCERAQAQGIDVAGRADFYDNTGCHISEKNPNRCEMTAHYWVWKNRLNTDDEYVGICHYRRMLDLSEEDLWKIKEDEVDVVLPFPMVHEPDSRIHHTWYVLERDWEVMLRALEELHPDDAARFDEVFDAPYFYNYNIMLAKKEVFAGYCAWLYPILDRIEELSVPKGADREDRYTAYMSESLTTLYFMTRGRTLKICHTGRLLFT